MLNALTMALTALQSTGSLYCVVCWQPASKELAAVQQLKTAPACPQDSTTSATAAQLERRMPGDRYSLKELA
jgi:hypothetical protein